MGGKDCLRDVASTAWVCSPPVWQTRTWIMCAAFWADSKQAQMRIDTSPHTAVTNQITDYVPHILSTLACPLQHPVTAEGPPKLSERFTQQGVFFAYKAHRSFYTTHQSKTQAFCFPHRILQCAEVGGPLMVTGCCATSLTPTFLVPPHCHSHPILPSFFYCPLPAPRMLCSLALTTPHSYHQHTRTNAIGEPSLAPACDWSLARMHAKGMLHREGRCDAFVTL